MSSNPSPVRTAATPAVPASPRGVRLPGLDGLRALAVISVIGYHFLPGSVVGGFVGVDVFFVISGFLITGLLLRERSKAGRIDLLAFWRRRARRLLPALAIVVATCGAVALLVGGDVLVGLGAQVLAAATFSSNWVFIAQGSSYFDQTTPDLFGNLWSLAVEEQFYLLWPLLVLLLVLLPRRWMRVLAVLLLAVASALAMALLFSPPGDATRVYYGTDTHSFGLALGAALAIVVEARFLSQVRASWIMALIGALAVGGIGWIAATMSADDPIVTRGGLLGVAVLTTLAIAGATTAGSWLGRALDVAPLRWVGERSYGLYLWHWPVLVLLIAALPDDAPVWIVPSVALVITVAAATASYHFVELPIRRGGLRGFGALPGRLVVGAGAFSLVAALTITAATLDPGKGEAQLAIEQGEAAVAAAASADEDRPLAFGQRRPTPLPTGDQIYAIGDSVMLAAAPWLQERLPGIAIDAEVSRSMWTAPDLVRAAVDAGAMRPILLLGLATNGDVDPADLQAVLDIVGPDTLVVVVNGQAPRDWIPIGNQTLADFARLERTVELANWNAAIAPQIYELASDQVHPGGPISGGIYVDSVCDALQRLAELPPLLDSNDYLVLNRPV